MKREAYVVILIIAVFLIQGCGETLRGIGRDFTRIGRGFKTIFVSDSI